MGISLIQALEEESRTDIQYSKVHRMPPFIIITILIFS